MEKVAAGIECLGRGHVFSDHKEGGLLHRVSQSGQTVSQKVIDEIWENILDVVSFQ